LAGRSGEETFLNADEDNEDKGVRELLGKVMRAEIVLCRLRAAFRVPGSRASVLLGLFLFSLSCVAFAAPQEPSLKTLTTIAAVHLLSASEAARGYPVRVQAVITYYDPYLNAPRRPVIMVTDATASIYAGLADNWTRPLKAGLRVEVTGRSNPGDFGPNISDADVRVLGPGVLPAHAPMQSMTRLLTGSEDAQWIELEGVVKSVEFSGGNLTLTLAMADGEIAATSVIEPGANYSALVDAKVRIRGIAGSLYNRRHQIFGAQLLFPGMATLTVEEPAPPNPFGLPVSAISSLMTYNPGRTFNHRVHLFGGVTLFWPGRLLCIQDGSQAVCAATSQATPLVPGETADVIGFPQIGAVSPTLGSATYTRGAGLQPVPVVSVDAAQAFGGEHDAQLVQIDGRLIAHDRAALDPTLVLSSGKFNFIVVLPKSADAKALLDLEEGSLVRVTGICSLQADPQVFTRHDGYPVAKYFEILLRSSQDVAVLERPSWWSAQHTLRVLAVALALTLGVLGWVAILRMRVKKQTELLQHQATHDGLTGIWNRKAVLDLLQREFEIAARAHSRIGIMMLDADHFKNVNDTYGHLGGDAVLKELSRRIQLTLRSYDITGRYGGEEFLIVLPGCTAEQIEASAERVRAAIADSPVLADGAEIAVTVSVGTAVLDPLLNTQRDALAAADVALYEAKHSGRNRVASGTLSLRRV
jgi:diguanylate cyclase (GGDEF)-like protein